MLSHDPLLLCPYALGQATRPTLISNAFGIAFVPISMTSGVPQQSAAGLAGHAAAKTSESLSFVERRDVSVAPEPFCVGARGLSEKIDGYPLG